MENRALTADKHALGRLIAADPAACAALNNVARVIREAKRKLYSKGACHA